MEKVLDFLPYPFLISEFQNGTYRNIYVNRKFEEEIGFSLEEVPDIDSWFSKAYPDPLYRQSVMAGWAARSDEARASGSSTTLMRVMITTKTSGEEWYEVKSSDSGSLRLVAFVCISDVIAKERELERLVETKNRTLSILAHDVRGPLMNLHAMTQLMLSGNLSSTDFITKIAKVHEKSAEVLEFIDTTLLWTKTNFNAIRVNPEPVNVKECASRILNIYENIYQMKNITVSMDVANENHVMDKEIFTIVLRNIFSNAIKFTPANGSIDIRARFDGPTLRVTIKDSGVGMSQEMIDRIYMENYTSTPGTHEEKGLGLGLKLCRHLIKKVDGTLEITSRPGSGTEVTIRM